jgi:hypothetical protein
MLTKSISSESKPWLSGSTRCLLCWRYTLILYSSYAAVAFLLILPFPTVFLSPLLDRIYQVVFIDSATGR